MWTEKNVNFEGKFYKAKDAVIDPEPVQKPYPEVLFGGSGNRMLALAGQYGDIVNVKLGGYGGTQTFTTFDYTNDKITLYKKVYAKKNI